MVHTMSKRPSILNLPIMTDDYLLPVAEVSEKRSKSPSRPKSSTRKNSIERRSRLVKKKSSKDKENLLQDINIDSNVCRLSPFKIPVVGKNSLKNKLTNKPFTCGKLFDAVLDDDFSLVRECLIAEQMDVNEYSPEGTTALHLASAAGYLECLELLIECGANVNLKDANGRTSLEYAVLYGNFDCATLLIDNGADSKCIKNGIN